MYGLITGNAITFTDSTMPITFSDMATWRSWSVARTPAGPGRWRWTASGPKGQCWSDVLSEAVAKSRALRAYEELA